MNFMRRAFLPFMLLVAFIALPAAAHAASAKDVIGDCTDDEILQGSYTQKELANALAKLGSDAAEYTDCARVIHNAQLALASGAKSSGSNTPGTGTQGGTGSGTKGGTGTATTPTTPATPETSGTAPGAFGGFSGYPANPTQSATPQERAAIREAQASPVAQQRTELASTTLPGPMIAALAAGGVGLLVLLLLDLRRRVLARRG
jgi:hypothetical protein